MIIYTLKKYYSYGTISSIETMLCDENFYPKVSLGYYYTFIYSGDLFEKGFFDNRTKGRIKKLSTRFKQKNIFTHKYYL